MGIPTFFRYLLQTYGSTIYSLKPPIHCDYLYVDFNSIIYNVYFQKKNHLTLIQDVVVEISRIYTLNKPKILFYIAIDGVVPRAKMQQQRSRRYKSSQLEELFSEKNEFKFNPSNNICPGTVFMDNLLKEIKKIDKSKFSCEFFVDDQYHFGEGEHKILPHIRNLAIEDPNAKIIVFSPDNDLLSLLSLSRKKYILLSRYIDDVTKKQVTKQLNQKNQKNLDLTVTDKDFVFINIDLIFEKFLEEEFRRLDGNNYDPNNLLLDYNFLLSFSGNDFIPSLPYMKIKSGGLDKVLQIYTNILKSSLTGTYLIDYSTLRINKKFLLQIINALSYTERNDFMILGNLLSKEKLFGKSCYNELLSNKVNMKIQLEHLYLCNKHNPLYNEYSHEFEKINFNFKDKKIFKYQYYSHFLGLSYPSNLNDRNILEIKKKDMVKNYLKSLQFCLYYYNKECPSRAFYYPYRCAPLFSDILYHLNNTIDFEKDLKIKNDEKEITIDTPFQQLCMILPYQNHNILPASFQRVFNKYSFNYPKSFMVDSLQGLKYIYSEAILNDFQYLNSMIKDIKDIEKNYLSNEEKKRNICKFN